MGRPQWNKIPRGEGRPRSEAREPKGRSGPNRISKRDTDFTDYHGEEINFFVLKTKIFIKISVN